MNNTVSKPEMNNGVQFQAHSKALKGTVLVTVSAVAFAFMSIFAKYAYAANLNILNILSWRFLIAAVVMWLVVFARKMNPILEKKQLLALFGLGAMGYGLMSSFYFGAVKLIPASIASILLYTYPAIVTVLSSLIYKEKITRNRLVALIISSVGLIMVVGIAFDGLNITGVLCGLMAALVYSFYIIASNKYVKAIDPILCTTYISTSAAIVFIVAAFLGGEIKFGIETSGWMAIFGIAIISSVLAIITFFQGLRLVGPAKASIISTMEPVVTIIAAFLLFAEKMGAVQILGACLVILAVMLIQRDQ